MNVYEYVLSYTTYNHFYEMSMGAASKSADATQEGCSTALSVVPCSIKERIVAAECRE
jgi:hypothetical protein